jgi:hypothetical protein
MGEAEPQLPFTGLKNDDAYPYKRVHALFISIFEGIYLFQMAKILDIFRVNLSLPSFLGKCHRFPLC